MKTGRTNNGVVTGHVVRLECPGIYWLAREWFKDFRNDPVIIGGLSKTIQNVENRSRRAT
jgi:hypothetical protein